MKDKTLCLYWSLYDRILNIRRIDNEIEFEIKSGTRDVAYVRISWKQMKEFKDWMKENEI